MFYPYWFYTSPCLGSPEVDTEPEPSDTTVRFWCPELTQEGQWRHVVLLFHKAGIMKNSSVSLFIDGVHVSTQKVGCDLASSLILTPLLLAPLHFSKPWRCWHDYPKLFRVCVCIHWHPTSVAQAMQAALAPGPMSPPGRGHLSGDCPSLAWPWSQLHW